MNGHLEARSQALRSFQTVEHARPWFNGYILKRRFTKFTDCRGRFRYLRGKTGVKMIKKEMISHFLRLIAVAYPKFLLIFLFPLRTSPNFPLVVRGWPLHTPD